MVICGNVPDGIIDDLKLYLLSFNYELSDDEILDFLFKSYFISNGLSLTHWFKSEVEK